jgi:peptide/nickel transport system ATP-binding protein
MILITPDLAVVAYACDRVAVMYAGRIVEAGTAAEVLERPQHPYTMGLTHAFPDLHRAGAELVPIEGSPPLLIDPRPGCRFAPRCPFAVAHCHAETPPATLSDGHTVACFRAGEAARLREAAANPATWSVA